MARIPLEDNFTDVIGKAQRGWKITDAELCTRAGVSRADLAADFIAAVAAAEARLTAGIANP